MQHSGLNVNVTISLMQYIKKYTTNGYESLSNATFNVPVEKKHFARFLSTKTVCSKQGDKYPNLLICFMLIIK